MKKAKIADLKNNLSRYLDYVRGGQSVLVFDRDQPIAQIVPLRQSDRSTMENEPRLTRLERKGFIRRGSGGLPAWLGKRKPPRLRGSVLADHLKEREVGW